MTTPTPRSPFWDAAVIPGIGMLAGALGFGSVAFGSTYALGKLFTAHFASGGTLLNFDISKLRELGRSAA